MPYILYKSNGSVLTTINDAELDNKTSLGLVGKNYSGYGVVVNQNFVNLLENFSNNVPPARPITGQVWYNSSTKTLQVYNGRAFKRIANIFVQPNSPSEESTGRQQGDLWWDPSESKLKVYDGAWQIIGPLTAIDSKAYWFPDPQKDVNGLEVPILKASVSKEITAVVSNIEYTPDVQSEFQVKFPKVYKGITLPGASEITGDSSAGGYYFWGTAKHSEYAVRAGSADSAPNAEFANSATSADELLVGTNYRSASISTIPLTIAVRDTLGDINANVFKGLATSARYADLAERYAADHVYDPGTLLTIGGEKEVTICTEDASVSVAGIVSKNPAYMMNAEAGDDSTHPYVALKGRIPCKVFGAIKKGDLLVSSSYPGHARAFRQGDRDLSVIAIALESHSAGIGVIEVKV